MQTTKAMRDRIKELATPERDDFDRAVNMLLADFEAQTAALKKARDFLAADLATYFDADGERIKGRCTRTRQKWNKPLRWLRQGGAALVFVIICSLPLQGSAVEFEGGLIGVVSETMDSGISCLNFPTTVQRTLNIPDSGTCTIAVTKKCESLDIKPVQVSDFSPDIDVSALINNAGVLGLGRVEILVANHVGALCDNDRAEKINIPTNRKKVAHSVLINRNSDKPSKFAGGQIANVSNQYLSDASVTRGAKWPNAKAVYSDVSTLHNTGVGSLCGCGVFSVAGESVGRLPKLFGREPKSPGENSKYDCEKCGDGPLMLMSHSQKPLKPGEDGAVEGGAFFFSLLSIATAAGLVSYWMASKQ